MSDGTSRRMKVWAERGQRRLWVGLLLVLAVGGTLFLYREALNLPFLFDDMIHLRWLDGNSLFSIWTTAKGLGYYRPLTMSVWKVGYLLLGRNDPAIYHLFNLILHALNGCLAGCIAWRAYAGRGRMAYSLLAAALFLTFPFSYQAVPSSSSLSKPLIASLTLTSALLYWEARRRKAGWLLGLSLLVGLLAPFAYETGVMIPLAIIAIELLGCARREFERLSWWPLLYLVLIWGVGLPMVVLMEPEGGAPLRLPALLTLWQNGVYFAQGLVFPIAPLATPLAQLLPIDEYLLVAVLCLLGLGALFVLYRWAGQIDLFLYGLSWFVVGILPLWLMLDFDYVINSPRILYLGAVGSALLWAGVPILLWIRLPRRRWLQALAAAGIAGMLLFNVGYVRHRMTLAQAMASPLWQAAEAAQAHGSDSELLYLNVPAWIAPQKPTYRIGTEGLTFIPEYVRVQDFVYATTGVEPKIRSVTFDAVKQDWADTYIGYAGLETDGNGVARRIRRVEAVYLTTYAAEGLAGGLQFVEAGALEASGSLPAENTPLARFDDQILLLDAQIEPTDGGLILRLWWSIQQTQEQDVTTFVHVYDRAGQLVAQADGYPLRGLFPPQQWQPGDLVRDIRTILLPDNLPEGAYTIALGWYDKNSGARLPALDRQGQPVADDAVPIFP